MVVTMVKIYNGCLLRREKWVQTKIEVTFFPDLIQSVSLVQVQREEFDAFFFISLWSTLGLWSIFVVVLLGINPTMATRSKDVKKQTYHLKNVIANNTKFLVVYLLILLEILEHIIHSLACERNSISKGTSNNIDNL